MKSLLLLMLLLGSSPLFANTADSTPVIKPNVQPANIAVRVFPNPLVNDLYITVREDGLQIKTVLLYDKDGNRVIEQKIHSSLSAPVKLFTGNLPKGLYYLVLETNRQPLRFQLVKQ